MTAERGTPRGRPGTALGLWELVLGGVLLAGPVGDGIRLATPLLGVGVILGLLAAMALTLPSLLVAALAVVAGGLIGLDSARDMLATPGALMLLLGGAIGAVLLVLYLAAITVCLQSHWQKIGVRIIGSWMATSALLVLVLKVARSTDAG